MILVIGGTGLIGSELLRLLSQADVPARALVRNPNKMQELPGITWVVGDLARSETLTTAFEGATTVFLPHTLLRRHGGVAAQCHRCSTCRGRYTRREGIGIRRYTPITSPDRAMALPGREGTARVGMAWTILRPHHFMQNPVSKYR